MFFCFVGLHFDFNNDRNTSEYVHRQQVRQTSDHVGLDGALRFFNARHRNAHGRSHLFLYFVHVDTDGIAEHAVLFLGLRRVSHSLDASQ